jgi:hypothetical protein
VPPFCFVKLKECKKSQDPSSFLTFFLLRWQHFLYACISFKHLNIPSLLIFTISLVSLETWSISLCPFCRWGNSSTNNPVVIQNQNLVSWWSGPLFFPPIKLWYGDFSRFNFPVWMSAYWVSCLSDRIEILLLKWVTKAKKSKEKAN